MSQLGEPVWRKSNSAWIARPLRIGEFDLRCNRRCPIGRKVQHRAPDEERSRQDLGEYRQRVDAGIEHAEATRLEDPGLARMPDADVFLPDDA